MKKKLFVCIAIVIALSINILVMMLYNPTYNSNGVNKIEHFISLHEEEILNLIPNNYESIVGHVRNENFSFELVYEFEEPYYIDIDIPKKQNDNINIKIKNNHSAYVNYDLTEDGSLEKVKDSSSDYWIRIIMFIFIINIVFIIACIFIYIEFIKNNN